MTSPSGALASRDFRLLFGGQIVSLTGSQMQQVAVAWQLYLLTHSSWALGLLGLYRVAPVIVFALGGGVIADAFDRRRLMIFTQSALALTSLALALFTHFGHATPMTLYVLAALAGGAFAFDAPARQALIPRLVTREQLPNALSLSAMAWQIAAVVGPALGGVALAWRGVVPIYVFDALSFLAVIGALLAIRHRAPARSSSGVSLAAAWEGLRFLRRTPIILWTMVLDFVATFFAGAMLLMPIFADQLLHVGPRGLGLLYAAQPVGAAIAAAALSILPAPRRQGWTVLGSVAVYGRGDRRVRRVALALAVAAPPRHLRRGRHREHGGAPDLAPAPHPRCAARPDDLGEHDLLHGRPAARRGRSGRGGQRLGRAPLGRLGRGRLRGGGDPPGRGAPCRCAA